MAQAFVSNGLGFTVFFGILLLIMETLGNYLLFCMVWYEKFGMDSKKRTISNQLLSRMILAVIVFNILFMPLVFGTIFIPYSEYFQGFYIESLLQSLISMCKYHFYFMIIDEYGYLFIEFGMSRIIMHIMLTLAEMMIFKILYMFKFSVIAIMDEYYLTHFLTLFNIMINFGLAIIRVWLNEHRRTKRYFDKFAKPYEVYKKIPWP